MLMGLQYVRCCPVALCISSIAIMNTVNFLLMIVMFKLQFLLLAAFSRRQRNSIIFNDTNQSQQIINFRYSPSFIQWKHWGTDNLSTLSRTVSLSFPHPDCQINNMFSNP